MRRPEGVYVTHQPLRREAARAAPDGYTVLMRERDARRLAVAVEKLGKVEETKK